MCSEWLRETDYADEDTVRFLRKFSNHADA